MPPEEGDALYEAALAAALAVPGAPFVEVGSYCGRSTIWLGAAAREAATVVFAVDHHRGSEENQAGWEHHDPIAGRSGVGPHGHAAHVPPHHRRCRPGGRGGRRGRAVGAGRRRALVDAGWRSCSSTAATGYSLPVTTSPVGRPTSPLVALLAIHDVFPDPADGGRPPYEDIYLPALASGRFTEVSATGSLRVLRCATTP